jgi:hypothetical protein
MVYLKINSIKKDERGDRPVTISQILSSPPLLPQTGDFPQFSAGHSQS